MIEKSQALSIETERKFLISYPVPEAVLQDPCQIRQTYLKSDGDSEIRIRRTLALGSYTYYKTEKRNISSISREERELEISKEDYEGLLLLADPDLGPISKIRYRCLYEGHVFEIDVYPFWDECAIMEVELCSEDEEIVFPPEIKIIKEVTKDAEYKNASLAKKFLIM